MFESSKGCRVDRTHTASLRLGSAFLPAGDVTELSDVITGKPDAYVRFELFSLQQNAELLVTNLRAFLKRDFIGPGEHQGGYDERDASRLTPRGGDRKIESAGAVFNAFESQIADVLLHVFHNGGFTTPGAISQRPRTRGVST